LLIPWSVTQAEHWNTSQNKKEKLPKHIHIGYLHSMHKELIMITLPNTDLQ
jgi:hypothetical protein